MSEILNFDDTSPAADSGYTLVKWKKNTTPDGVDPTTGYSYFDLSGELPNAGTAVVKTANYPATRGDMGMLLVFNSASAVTLTLPNPVPLNALATPTTETRWKIAVQNVGAGVLTIARNGLLIDTAAANLTLNQNSGVEIFTDGTNYFTERGVATPQPSGAANLVEATPDGSSGAASLRALVAADIPSLPESKITNLVTDLAAKVPATRTIATTAPLTGGGDLSANRTLAISTFVASGAGHAAGIVPDPGASAGTTKYLREDGTFAVPPGTGASLSVTTKGDLQGFSTVAARIPVGSDGQVLTADSTQTLGVKYATPSAGASVNFAQGTATASSGNNTIALNLTPLAGSVSVFVAGLIVAPTAYTISGINITLTTALTAGNVVVVIWASSSAGTGSIALSTVSVNPALRGSGITSTVGGSSITISFPAGTVAGDLAVLCVGSQNSISTPTGWTLQTTTAPSFWAGGIYTKVLTSGDITTGTVTANSTGDSVATIATFIGSTAGIRETPSDPGSGTGTTHSVSTSSGVLSTDSALYFASNRGSGALTFSRGTLKQQGNNGSAASACLYYEAISAAGVVTAVSSYPSYNPSGFYDAIVIVKGV